jgi:hypothetical protein
MTETQKPEAEAVVEEVKVEEAKPVAKKAPAKKAAPVKEAAPEIIWFETREKEPSMFPVAGINPVRNFSTGRLEYRVKSDDVARFEQNHFVINGRVKRKV